MNRFLYHLGNALILLSLAIIIFMFFPVIKTYITAPSLQPVAQKGTHITIPKISAQAPIIENVDPWKESEYLDVLKRGVAHAKGTSRPGTKEGTVFLFAHSSGPPWELTWMNTVFLRLNELEKGDKIEITKNGKKLVYAVTDKKEVWPDEVNYLLETEKDQLILQTCTPIGTSLKRLLIFAHPEK